MNTAINRKPTTQHLLDKLDDALKLLKSVPTDDAHARPKLDGIVQEIDRAYRNFGANLFFIVIFGPLKAGKSTLTNALAGEYVSPTGFGKETTRRPSFVIKDTESGIDQYYARNSSVIQALAQASASGDHATSLTEEDAKLVHAAFDSVADHIREVRTWDEIKDMIRKESFPLTKLNLDRLLVDPAMQEPLITVIRCRGGDLLGGTVALVDMPGLDGMRSNWKSNPIHTWVVKRAEFLLFVQSSVAAFNKDTEGFLKDIVENSTKPPIWQLQNIFAARHWQPQEQQQCDANEQLEEGHKRINAVLKMNPRGRIGINLGKAWDGINDNNSQWLSESEFTEFENELSKILKAERAQIQEQNSFCYLSQKLDESKKQYESIKGEIKAARDGFKEKRNFIEEKKRAIGRIDYRKNNIYVETKIKQLDATLQPWRDYFNREFDKMKINIKIKKNGQKKTLGKNINECIKTRAGIIDTWRLDKNKVLPMLVELAKDDAAKVETDYLQEQQDDSIIPLPTTDHVPDIKDHEPFYGDVHKLQAKTMFGFDAKYKDAEINDHLDKLKERWEEIVDKTIGHFE